MHIDKLCPKCGRQLDMRGTGAACNFDDYSVELTRAELEKYYGKEETDRYFENK